MKKAGMLFCAVAVLLSDIMCAAVAYGYRDMLCGIEHMGYSAPAGTAFLHAVPFLAGIAVSAALAIRCFKKSKQS